MEQARSRSKRRGISIKSNRVREQKGQGSPREPYTENEFDTASGPFGSRSLLNNARRRRRPPANRTVNGCNGGQVQQLRLSSSIAFC
ncbi:hypothetical protein EVAR_57825_1 [Eumeta japonica]|uniref:Uncharacterized protein n=1 Tax=Eumeta variegata TaxID=151549 RepID=A0A4C2A0I2_EUMVA|nr:hypothetical protein EVAR_57825_1 [Eumeta japonica]